MERRSDAELLVNDAQFAELRHEHEQLLVEIYSQQDGAAWAFSYHALTALLWAAKDKLMAEPSTIG